MRDNDWPARTVAVLVALGTLGLAACSSAADQAPTQPRPVAASSSGGLFVTSQPSGAVVIIDGRRAGWTPLKIKSPVGTHMVVLQRGGQNYGPHPVVVSAGETARLTLKLEAKAAVKPRKKRSLTAGERHEEEQRQLGKCFPKGWAGERPPETVVARATLNDSGRLVRMTIDHPSAGYSIERCVEALLRPKYETRVYQEGIAGTHVTIKIILR